jgi:hypothetical protein
MDQPGKIRTAQTQAPDPVTAAAEFYDRVRQESVALVVFFCSSSYDLETLAAELARRFAGVPLMGCTTAGEIGPSGYSSHSLSGASLSADAFTAAIGRLDRLQEFEMGAGSAFAQNLLASLGAKDAKAKASNTFGLLLIDGLCMREEPVAHALQEGLGGIQMIGGSAGDDLKFQQTWVFHDGRFHSDGAVLALVSTPYPFQVLRTQHFVAAGERLVVTAADVGRRVVKEINGLPAVQEYARLTGIPEDRLDPSHFAAWPVVVMIDGTDYVRSIQHANPDGSLSFYCAIDEGVVMRVARGEDMLGKLEATFADLEKDLGELQGIFVCDCILRNLEATSTGIKSALGEVFRRHRAVGFSTYGEQYHGVHVNQTMTAIAIGRGDDAHG